MRRLSLLSAVAVAIGVGAAVPGTASAQFRCGYHEQGGYAYYGHCDAPPRTDVMIVIDPAIGGNYTMCVKPGLHTLGFDSLFENAWYNGNLCNAG